MLFALCGYLSRVGSRPRACLAWWPRGLVTSHPGEGSFLPGLCPEQPVSVGICTFWQFIVCVH